MTDRRYMEFNSGYVEYGVVFASCPDDLHRGPMTLDAAERWIKQLVEDGGKRDSWYIVSRRVDPWRECK